MSFQEILKTVALWDISLFRWINQDMYVQWLAEAADLFARDYFILFFLISLMIFYAGWRGWRNALVLGFWSMSAVVITNILHNHLLKPFFNRPRPFISLENVRLSAPLTDLSMLSLSFPSTHAASSAALAVIAIKMDKACTWPVVAFALAIGFFTVYSGGHYPFDVFAGYIVGMFIGLSISGIKKFLWPDLPNNL